MPMKSDTLSNEIFVDGAVAAISVCRHLIKEGRANIFRGQTQAWPMTPSIYRHLAQQSQHESRLQEFIDWMQFTPRLLGYDGNAEAQIAIAQHYGIPTAFLDVSRSPEVAAFFALGGKNTDQSTQSVIYAGRREAISTLFGCRPIQIDVENLWRLEAQEGEFIHLQRADEVTELTSLFTKVIFPKVGASPLSSEEIYPSRRSDLEIVLDQYFYRSQIEGAISEITAAAHFVMRRKRQTYPGAYPRRQTSGPQQSWLTVGRRWLLPQPESVSVISARSTLCDTVVLKRPLRTMRRHVERLLGFKVRNAWQSRGFLEFDLTWRRSKSNERA